MFLAYIPVKNGCPQEPKVIECDTCEASLYAGEYKIGVFKTKEEAIKAAHKEWLLVVCDKEGKYVWCYAE